MKKTVLVTGCLGMVGGAVQEFFRNSEAHADFTVRPTCRQEFDLRKEQSVRSLYELTRPDYVVHCAAVVGGVKFNRECPDRLFRDNILMNANVIHYAHNYGVKKLIAFSSACAFQDGVFPFREENLQDGKPYVGNAAYGYAKRMVDVQIRTYNELYGRKDVTVIPTSLYGPNDNFSLENSHFVSGLIRKTHEAKKDDTPLSVWGDGSPLRELLYVKDLAKILVELLEKDVPDKLIVPGQEVSVSDVVKVVTEEMDFDGEIRWEKDKPNGQHRKPTDPARFREVVGDFHFTPYREGLRQTIEWYVKKKKLGLSVRE